ncbi:hypothetical protein QAD02_012379 [Eretmocerus hayati]|uniref:Uncharacterized protein n=1 Tax=Eretmocerus hayati TaxID=131215 RepID=A0ACC2NZK5_9HYME|nr:hypothetical protein QAD02_012379 [Eretmocerus hayati]
MWDNYTFCNENLSSLAWKDYNNLRAAIRSKDVHLVEYLIGNGAQINGHPDRYHEYSPLHLAVISRCQKIVKILLDNGADANALDVTFNTPLTMAAKMENPIIVDLLLSYDVQINRYNTREGLSHLHIACMRNKLDVVKRLLKMGHNQTVNQPNSRSNKDRKEIEKVSLLHLACVNDDAGAMKYKIYSHFMINEPIWNGYTPLHIAAKYNSINAAQIVLARGADIMIEDSLGETPLHVAFKNNHTEIINAITGTFSDPTENSTDNEGLSFLLILCTTNNLKAIETILMKKIDINSKVCETSPRWSGFTPMQFACAFKQKDVVTLLLKHGADIFIKNGSISDHFNLVFDEFDCQSELLEFEKVLLETLMTVFSSPLIQNKYANDSGISPLHAICHNPHANLQLLERYLISRRNEINQIIEMPGSREFHKCAPLHFAMRYEDLQKAKLMVQAKADLHMINFAGFSPIGSCFLYGSPLDIADEEAEILFPVGIPIDSLRPSHFFVSCASYLFKFVNYVLNNVEDELKKSFVNCCSDTIRTPLHNLSWQRWLEPEDAGVGNA